MPVKILTVSFDAEKGIFEDTEVNRFLLNKHVKNLKAEFFQTGAGAYWTLFVEYEPLMAGEGESWDQGLNEPQKVLLHRLKQWRTEKAGKEGVPVFIIATNKELMEVVKRKPTTIEALRQISGFGKKKIERHGREIVDLVAAFFQKDAGNQSHSRKDSDRNA